jgi:esterase/lipase
MATFILIHGAWHGSWCWNKITANLVKNNHKVLTPDLPSYEDSLSVTVISFDDYISHIIPIINSSKEKVILVGHSMAGLIISSLAEKMPNNIQALVYLCAFMPNNGQSLMDIIDNRPNQHIELEFTENFEACKVKEEYIINAFYNNCSKKDINFAMSKLQLQPYNIFNTKIYLSKARYGKISKTYIECIKDNAIPLTIQREMIKKQSVDKVYCLNTDHSPFFSQPKELSKMLDEIASIYDFKENL